MPAVQDRETLICGLQSLNKRAHLILDSTERLSSKLHGSRPSETAKDAYDDSVMGLATRLSGTLDEIAKELDRAHSTIGEDMPKPSTNAAGY